MRPVNLVSSAAAIALPQCCCFVLMRHNLQRPPRFIWQTAFYFAWMNFYLRWLLVPGITGFLVSVHKVKSRFTSVFRDKLSGREQTTPSVCNTTYCRTKCSPRMRWGPERMTIIIAECAKAGTVLCETRLTRGTRYGIHDHVVLVRGDTCSCTRHYLCRSGNDGFASTCPEVY